MVADDIRRNRSLAVAFILGCTLAVAPGDAAQGQVDIESALSVARGSEPVRARFHAPYMLPVTEALVERLEVITEYRRMVLIAEQRRAAGDWSFVNSSRAATEALRPWKQTVTIRARIRFPVLHTYARLPAVSISVGRGPDLLRLIRHDSEPQHALRSNPSEVSTPLVGMVVDAVFDASTVGQRTLPMMMTVGPGVVEVRQNIDFSRLK